MLGIGIACQRLRRDDMQDPSVIIAAIAFLTIGVFSNGSLDHHNIQVAFSIWLFALLIPSEKNEYSFAWAGLICVLMLAIGMETLPYVTIAGIYVAISFALGALAPTAARAFGLSLGLSSVALFLATVSPAAYGAVYCDAYSSFHVVMCCVCGFGLAAAAHFGKGKRSRLTGLAALTVIAGVLLIGLFPACLADPLSTLDPKLREFWLDGVVETRSIFDLWATDPFALLGMYGLAIFGLGTSIFLALTEKHSIRAFAVLSIAMLVVAIGVTAWQQRAMIFSAAFAILPLGYVLTHVRSQYQKSKAILDLLKMIGFGILSLNMTWWVAGANAASFFSKSRTLQEQIATANPADYCYGADIYGELAKEPAGVVLGATDIGASVLLYTHHRVLAGPYHRNTRGNLLMIETMLATPDEAQLLARSANVTLVADCITSADAVDFKRASPNGLQSALHRGEVPSWLEILDAKPGSPLVLYRVRSEL